MKKEEMFLEMLNFFKTAGNETGGDLASIIEWFEEEIEKVGEDKLLELITNFKWIKILERMPKDDGHFLVGNPEINQNATYRGEIAFYSKDDNKFYVENAEKAIENITHWVDF